MRLKTSIGYLPLEIHPAAPAHRNRQKIWYSELPNPGSGNGFYPVWGLTLEHLAQNIDLAIS